MKAIPVSPWRWVALVAVIAEVTYERVHAPLAAHISSIGPGSSVVGAWSTVQVMLLWYGLAQLGEPQRPIPAHDRVSRLVVVFAMLSVLRLAVADPVQLALVSLALTATAAVAYLRLRHEIKAKRASGWIGVPFSMVLGWTSIIAAANVLAASGLAHPGPAVTMIAFVAGTAMYLGLHLRDFVLPGFVGWLLVAICATDRLAPSVTTCALLAGALCSIVAIVIAATRFSRSPQAASPSPTRRSRRA